MRLHETSRWSAPGRVNMIGEHLDYNGGLVLPFAIPQRLTVVVVAADGDQSRVRSAELGTVTFAPTAEPGGVTGFAARVAGVGWALRRRGHPVPAFDVEVESDVPLGAGLASSAALGCAVAAAVMDLLGLELDPVDVAQVAHEAESDFAGVPSGVMDQTAAMLCRAGHALLLDCSDMRVERVPFDLGSAGLALLVVDTRARHEHATGEYGERRAQCEAAAAALGLSALARATMADLDRLDDPVQRRRTRHVVTEMDRVRAAVELMRAGRLADLGPLLTASHGSLRDDFEVSCPELDTAVEAALAAGALGARMTGGGFGGCAIVLCREATAADVDPAAGKAEVAAGHVEAAIRAAEVAAGNVEAAIRAAYADNGWPEPRCWTVIPSPGAHPN